MTPGLVFLAWLPWLVTAVLVVWRARRAPALDDCDCGRVGMPEHVLAIEVEPDGQLALRVVHRRDRCCIHELGGAA